jgi:membrane protease YdiL (CAAX protease family)
MAHYQRFSVLNISLTIFVMAFAVLFPHYTFIPVPFGYTIIVLFFIWLLLRRTKEDFADIGFNLKQFKGQSVWIGIVAAVLLFLFLNYVLFPLIGKMVVLPKPNLTDFNSVRHHFYNYLFILIMGLLVGGVYEELVFHGFIFTRLERIIGGKYGTLISFLCANIVFGLYHVQLGAAGVLNAFFCGCAYQALMLRFNRNIWYAIFFHAFFDAIGLSLIYLGYW